MNSLKEKDEEAQELIKNLQVFEIVCSKMHKCFVPKVIIMCQTLIFIFEPNHIIYNFNVYKLIFIFFSF